MCITRQRRGGSPKTTLFEMVLCQGADKTCKAQPGKEIKGSQLFFFFFKKKLCNTNLKCEYLQERKKIKSLTKHFIKELKLAFENKGFLVHIII